MEEYQPLLRGKGFKHNSKNRCRGGPIFYAWCTENFKNIQTYVILPIQVLSNVT